MSKTSRIDSDKFIKVFPVRLRSLMKERGVGQKELADYVQVTQQVISQYMNGQTTPKLTYAGKIAEYLQVSLDYLCGISQVPTTDPDIKMIEQQTGLSNDAICTLQALTILRNQSETKKEEAKWSHVLQFISNVAADDEFTRQISSMIAALEKISDFDIPYVITPAYETDAEEHVTITLPSEENNLKDVIKASIQYRIFKFVEEWFEQ